MAASLRSAQASSYLRATLLNIPEGILSMPYALEPQQLRAPLLVTPQVLSKPPATSVNVPGGGFSAPPSSQHFASPATVTPQKKQ